MKGIALRFARALVVLAIISPLLTQAAPAHAESIYQAPFSIKAGRGLNNPGFVSPRYSSSTLTGAVCVQMSVLRNADWMIILYAKNQFKNIAVWSSRIKKRPGTLCSPDSVAGPGPTKFSVGIILERNSILSGVYGSGLYDIYVNFTCTPCG